MSKAVGDIVDIAKAGEAAGKDAATIAREIKAATEAAGLSITAVKDALAASRELSPALKDSLKTFEATAEETSAFAKAAEEAGVAARAGTAIKEGASAAGTAAKKAVQAGINTTGDFAKAAAKSCKESPKTCIGVALGSAAAIYAADKYLKVKNYKGKITKIEAGKDGGLFGIGGTNVAKVTYAEAIDILPSDTITFSGTDCQPSIDGDATPYKVASGTEVWIKVDDGLQAPGSKGDFKITTGVMERLGQAVGVGAGAAGRAAGTAAGAAAGGAASGLGEGGGAFLKSFTSGAGMWLTIILCCLCFAFIIFKFIL